MLEWGELLRAYFEPLKPCEVLGMKMVLDPERAKRLFTDIPPEGALRPQIFLEDPGLLAERIGLASLVSGDVFGFVNGGLSRYWDMYITTPADFVSAIATMHNPLAPTVCDCFRWDAQACKWARPGAGITVPDDEIDKLRVLRESLLRYAATKGLHMQTPVKYYNGEPYIIHRLKCWWRRRRYMAKETDKTGCPNFLMPVHKQCLSLLLHSICRGPYRFTVYGEENRLHITSDDEKWKARARELDGVMSACDVGSMKAFFRLVDSFVRATVEHGHMHLVLCGGRQFHAKAQVVGKFRVSFELEEAPEPSRLSG